MRKGGWETDWIAPFKRSDWILINARKKAFFLFLFHRGWTKGDVWDRTFPSTPTMSLYHQTQGQKTEILTLKFYSLHKGFLLTLFETNGAGCIPAQPLCPRPEGTEPYVPFATTSEPISDWVAFISTMTHYTKQLLSSAWHSKTDIIVKVLGQRDSRKMRHSIHFQGFIRNSPKWGLTSLLKCSVVIAKLAN